MGRALRDGRETRLGAETEAADDARGRADRRINGVAVRTIRREPPPGERQNERRGVVSRDPGVKRRTRLPPHPRDAEEITLASALQGREHEPRQAATEPATEFASGLASAAATGSQRPEGCTCGRRTQDDRVDFRFRLRARTLLFALLAALAVLPSAHAQLDTSVRDRLRSEAGDYQGLIEERRAEIQAIEAALGDTRAALQARVAERDRVSAQLGELEAEERALQQRIAELDAERAATEERIAGEEANLDLLRERIRALIVNLHRQRSGGGINALAGAESLHDLRVKNHYLDLLSRQDVQLVAEVDAQLAALRTLREDLAAQLAELATTQQQLAATRTGLETTRAELQSIIAELDATEQGQQAQRAAGLEAQARLEAELADTEARLQREIARLEAEERRLREQAQAFVGDRERRQELEAEADRTRERIRALTSPSAPNPSGFVGPLDGGQLVSRYGEGNNSFVSIRADEDGAPVYAVQGGVVIAAQSIGANDGFMVAVRHDDELTTVYTNLRSPPVQVGDTVNRGAVIGYLGGGTIPPPDVLRLYARLRRGGSEAFVDPLPLLGL